MSCSKMATPASGECCFGVGDLVFVLQGTKKGNRGGIVDSCPDTVLEVKRNDEREITHYVVKKFIERSSGCEVAKEFVLPHRDFGTTPLSGGRVSYRGLSSGWLAPVEPRIATYPLPVVTNGCDNA